MKVEIVGTSNFDGDCTDGGCLRNKRNTCYGLKDGNFSYNKRGLGNGCNTSRSTVTSN